MPLIRHEKPAIVVEIADRVDGGTRLKRKARFLNMTYSQNSSSGIFGTASGDSVVLNLTIELYAAGALDEATGVYAYGERLSGKRGYQDYPYQIIANNTTIVDAVSGDVLCERSVYDKAVRLSEESNLPLETVLPDILKGRDFMFEGERFRMVAEGVQITVDPMIINHIQKAVIA